MKTIKIIILCSLIILLSAYTVSAQEIYKSTSHGIFPNSDQPTTLDRIKNLFSATITDFQCTQGYVKCVTDSYSSGGATAKGEISISDPYIENGNLYINYKMDGTRFYVYRGLSSFQQIECSYNACVGGEEIPRTGKYLVDSAPSTTQRGVIFVVWDSDRYVVWNSVSYGWLNNYNYNLQVPTPTPTPIIKTSTPIPIPTEVFTPTEVPTQVGNVNKFVCDNGNIVPDKSLCTTESIFNNTTVIGGILLAGLIGGIYLYLKPSKKGR